LKSWVYRWTTTSPSCWRPFGRTRKRWV
jgi:hypothetical protein